MKNVKKVFLFCVFATLASCKTPFMTEYDPRPKTEEMINNENNPDPEFQDDPTVLTIIFEESMEGHNVKLESLGVLYTGKWHTYWDGELEDCTEYFCYVMKVSNTTVTNLYIDGKKTVLKGTAKHPLSEYRMVFVTDYGDSYKLYFTNFQKAFW